LQVPKVKLVRLVPKGRRAYRVCKATLVPKVRRVCRACKAIRGIKV